MKVSLIAALTADGFIGRDASHLADWTSKEDKQLFVRLTKEAGVIVMGSRTFATIGRALSGRRTIVYTHSPDTVQTEGVETTDEAPAVLIKRLEAEGAGGLAVCGGTSIYDLFVRAGVVDELYLTIAPKLFGTGIGLFTDKLDYDLRLVDTQHLNDNTILLQYKLKH